ncbi:MAG: hypothetical protein Kow00103_12010 [Candidatus Caldatribacteriota bacterium]
MDKIVKILLVEDLPSDVQLAEREISKVIKKYQIKVTEREKDFISLLEKWKPDPVISDFKLPSFDGLSAIKITLKKSPLTPLIILTGSINEDTAVECIKAGATDYVIKEHIKRLGTAILNALKQKEINIQRYRTEEKLRENEARLRQINDNISDVVFTMDMNMNTTYISPSIYKLTGFQVNDYLKKSLEEKHPNEAIKRFKKILKEELEKEKDPLSNKNRSRIIEFEHYKADGSLIIFQSHISFIRDKNGKPIGLQGVSRDITKLKYSQLKFQKAMDAIIKTISKMGEAKDPYTAGHQRRVSQLSLKIAQELCLSSDVMEGIKIAALIHDIGKIGISSEILVKPGQLSEAEFSLIKDHPNLGYNVLKDIEFPYPIAKIILQHHERINGSGYPQQLKGEEILLEAKIIGVADVVEAMSSHRPYRPALGIEAALDEISKNKGILYEPKVANTCIKLFKEKGFKFT